MARLPKYSTYSYAGGQIGLPIQADFTGLEMAAAKQASDDRAKAAAAADRRKADDKFMDKLIKVGSGERHASDMALINQKRDDIFTYARELRDKKIPMSSDVQLSNMISDISNSMRNSQGRSEKIVEYGERKLPKHVSPAWNTDAQAEVANAGLNEVGEHQPKGAHEYYDKLGHIQEIAKQFKDKKITNPVLMDAKYGQLIKTTTTITNMTDDQLSLVAQASLDSDDIFKTAMIKEGDALLKEETLRKGSPVKGMNLDEAKAAMRFIEDPSTPENDFMDDVYWARKATENLLKLTQTSNKEVKLTTGHKAPTGRGLGEGGVGFSVERDTSEKIKGRTVGGEQKVLDTHVWSTLNLDQSVTGKKGGISVKADIVNNAETNKPLSTYLGGAEKTKDWIKYSKFIPNQVKEYTYDPEKKQIKAGKMKDIIEARREDLKTKKFVEGTMRITLPGDKEDDIFKTVAQQKKETEQRENEIEEYNKKAEEEGLEKIDIADLNKKGYYDLTVRIPYDKVSGQMEASFGITPESVEKEMGTVSFTEEDLEGILPPRTEPKEQPKPTF